ncbi:hypothetical protein MPH_14056, partial [Macrophomina phaseolina MS6]
ASAEAYRRSNPSKRKRKGTI